MGEGGKCVLRDFALGRFCPRCIATLGLPDFGIARIIGIGRATGEVHGLAIGSEATSTFLVGGVDFGFHHFGLSPLTIFIFLCQEKVRKTGSRDAAIVITCGIVSSGGNDKLLTLIAYKHWTEIAAARIENAFFLDSIEIGIRFPLRSHLARKESHVCQFVSWILFQIETEILFCLFVIANFELLLCQVEKRQTIGILISHCILIGCHRLLGIVDVAIAFAHHKGTLSTLLLVFRRNSGIGFLEKVGGIVVFAHSVCLLPLFVGNSFIAA